MDINRFSAGILKNPKFELSRSGKMCEAAKTAYTIKGNPIRVGQLYIVAVQSTAGISRNYYGVVNAQKGWLKNLYLMNLNCFRKDAADYHMAECHHIR